MLLEIDARGEVCPKPVIMTKKEIDKIEEGIVVTRVDNEVAITNLSKLAENLGCDYTTEVLGEDDFKISITKGEGSIAPVEDSGEFKDMTIAFASDKMGEGSDELGAILVKSLMYTITETEPLPKTIIFYNGGVRLTCKDSPVLEDLKTLADAGVEIVSCGTCLDFFEIKDDLRVGEISNMYTIYEKLRDPAKNVIIG